MKIKRITWRKEPEYIFFSYKIGNFSFNLLFPKYFMIVIMPISTRETISK